VGWPGDETMKYCRRCAADLNGADICPACGTKVEAKEVISSPPRKEITFKPVPKQKDPKDMMKKVVIYGIIIIVILIAVKIVFFPYRPAPINVQYQGAVIEDNVLGDIPIGVSGRIMNVAEDNRVIPISDVRINIGSSANVVLDRDVVYPLEDIITTLNITEIQPGGVVEFYIELPEFKDEITVFESTEITYYVSLYYNNEFNDSETFNVAHLYE
jgi:hypothetical protein